MSKIQSAINKAKREGVYEGKAVIQEHKFKKSKEYLNKRDIGPARTEIQVDYSTTKVLSIDQKRIDSIPIQLVRWPILHSDHVFQ